MKSIFTWRLIEQDKVMDTFEEGILNSVSEDCHGLPRRLDTDEVDEP